jgi:archaemetzincin
MTSPGPSVHRFPSGELSFFPRAPRRLRIVPLAPEPPNLSLLEWVAGALAACLDVPVAVDAVLPAEPDWLSPERSQLLSNRIIDTLIDRFPLDEEDSSMEWVLALTAADLRGREREFVFGEAAMGGGWAVVSVARFGESGQRLNDRLLKEALHELGHVAGVPHCDQVGCVMLPSAGIADVDAKSTVFCDSCRLRGDGG